MTRQYDEYVKYISHQVQLPIVQLHALLITAFALQMLTRNPMVG